jgi:hypothetical protein
MSPAVVGVDEVVGEDDGDTGDELVLDGDEVVVGDDDGSP